MCHWPISPTQTIGYKTSTFGQLLFLACDETVSATSSFRHSVERLGYQLMNYLNMKIPSDQPSA